MITNAHLTGMLDPKLTKYLSNKFCDDETFSARLEELLKYLYLGSTYPSLQGTFIPVTRDVDDLWHEIILQTASYQRLCERLPGRRMMHHESLTFDEYKAGIPGPELVKEILSWLAFYVKTFGPLPDERVRYWFFIRMVKESMSITMTDLNQMAQNDAYFSAPEAHTTEKRFKSLGDNVR